MRHFGTAFEVRAGAIFSNRLGRWGLGVALLACLGFGPGSCVSGEQIAACETACEEGGGIAWVISEEAETYDCICVDWTFVELEGTGGTASPTTNELLTITREE